MVKKKKINLIVYPVIVILVCVIGVIVYFNLPEMPEPEPEEIKFMIKEDSYTVENIPKHNFGQEKTLWIYYYPTLRMISWVKVDLSAFQGDIVSARIHVYVPEECYSPAPTAIHYSSHDEWLEGDVGCSGSEMCDVVITWNRQPFYRQDYIDSKGFGIPNKWYAFDVTDEVKSEINQGNKIATFVFTQLESEEGGAGCMSSSESLYPPYMIVEYYS